MNDDWYCSVADLLELSWNSITLNFKHINAIELNVVFCFALQFVENCDVVIGLFCFDCFVSIDCSVGIVDKSSKGSFFGIGFKSFFLNLLVGGVFNDGLILWNYVIDDSKFTALNDEILLSGRSWINYIIKSDNRRIIMNSYQFDFDAIALDKVALIVSAWKCKVQPAFSYVLIIFSVSHYSEYYLLALDLGILFESNGLFVVFEFKIEGFLGCIVII